MLHVDELAVTFLLFSWVVFVVTFLTKKVYNLLIKQGMKPNVVVYYNRKIVHVLAGGLCALIVPIVYRSFVLPLLMSIILAILLFSLHKNNRLMYWFQTRDNTYEVSFCIMWGITISLGWILTGGDFRIGVLPILFMSIGDAVTGVVRNMIYGRRTKSWWGNLAMALFSIPIGAIMGLAGMFAGAVASFIEHFEIKPIDDNVLIPLTSFITLLLAHYLAPWSLTL